MLTDFVRVRLAWSTSISLITLDIMDWLCPSLSGLINFN